MAGSASTGGDSAGTDTDEQSFRTVLAKVIAYLFGIAAISAGFGAFGWEGTTFSRVGALVFYSAAGLYAFPIVRRQLPLPPTVTNYPSQGATGIAVVVVLVLGLAIVGSAVAPPIPDKYTDDGEESSASPAVAIDVSGGSWTLSESVALPGSSEIAPPDPVDGGLSRPFLRGLPG